MKTQTRYVIVRSTNAGCFAGDLVGWDPKTRIAILNNCRRLWYWEGAASLSQLATEGTSKPSGCKFPPPTNNHTITGVDELIKCTAVAQTSIRGVIPWRA
jgi:hypothetical protein